MKITSDESKCQQRLDSTPWQKQAAAHSVQIDVGSMVQSNAKKETLEVQNKTDSIEQLADKVGMFTNLIESLAETIQKDHMFGHKLQTARKERL